MQLVMFPLYILAPCTSPGCPEKSLKQNNASVHDISVHDHFTSIQAETQTIGA